MKIPDDPFNNCQKVKQGILVLNKTRALIFLLLFYSASIFAAEPARLPLHFFGSPTCGECLEITHSILLPIQQANPGKLDLRIYDIESDSGFNLLVEMEKKYGVKISAPQELFFPDTFLIGKEDINAHARQMINYYLAHPEKWTALNHRGSEKYSNSAANISEKFKSYSIVSIIFAGLIDGINPCAIATMIFLVSFLGTKKRSRKQILTVGLCFTMSVFLTYLLLGIGAFKIITALDQYRWLSKGIRWTAVGFAGVVGILSFGDAIRYCMTRRSEDIKLQLPKAIKLRIHKVISGNLSGRQLITGAIVTGFLVTLLEAVCTGQVYLPTIVLMTKQQGLRFIGWLYLVFYNFLFVVPLFVVMILAYFGMKWDRLAKATQKNLVGIKILFGVVLIGLAAFLAIAG
jgi:cytochrome c biogenesis protein CcdA